MLDELPLNDSEWGRETQVELSNNLWLLETNEDLLRTSPATFEALAELSLLRSISGYPAIPDLSGLGTGPLFISYFI